MMAPEGPGRPRGAPAPRPRGGGVEPGDRAGRGSIARVCHGGGRGGSFLKEVKAFLESRAGWSSGR